MRRYLAITGLLGLAVATFVAVTTLAFSAPADVAQKRAEAERVLAEIQELDGRLGLAIENYNGATSSSLILTSGLWRRASVST